MGSRAVLVVCRSASAGSRRFGIAAGGTIYTRTGRPFFGSSSSSLETAILERVRTAVGAAGLWDELGTDWLLLDAEVLPWSAKAEPLIREQYASVAAAAGAALPAAQLALSAALQRGIDVAELSARFAHRASSIAAFTEVYRRYCWPTDGVDGLRLAPFHVLAGEGGSYLRQDHEWHLALVDRLVAASGLFVPTRRLVVDPASPADVAAATDWWLDLTGAGGEGMVLKPAVDAGPRVQPALKCRGREYLRIIYGPDYLSRLEPLRGRGLQRKRNLALREHGLGLAALDLLAAGGPGRAVHQLVFAVLACESEPVDPRL